MSHLHTRSSNNEMKMTRRICFRLAGETGVADMVQTYVVGKIVAIE